MNFALDCRSNRTVVWPEGPAPKARSQSENSSSRDQRTTLSTATTPPWIVQLARKFLHVLFATHHNIQCTSLDPKIDGIVWPKIFFYWYAMLWWLLIKNYKLLHQSPGGIIFAAGNGSRLGSLRIVCTRPNRSFLSGIPRKEMSIGKVQGGSLCFTISSHPCDSRVSHGAYVRLIVKKVM